MDLHDVAILRRGVSVVRGAVPDIAAEEHDAAGRTRQPLRLLTVENRGL